MNSYLGRPSPCRRARTQRWHRTAIPDHLDGPRVSPCRHWRRAVEHPSARPLPRAHLGVRPAPVDPVLTQHKLLCMARLLPGRGGDQSSTTSRLPPRCTVARQGTEEQPKSVTACCRPACLNTHVDARGCGRTAESVPQISSISRSHEPPASAGGTSTSLRPVCDYAEATCRESGGGEVGRRQPPTRAWGPPLRANGRTRTRGPADSPRAWQHANMAASGWGRRAADWTRARRGTRYRPARLNIHRSTPRVWRSQQECADQQCSIG